MASGAEDGLQRSLGAGQVFTMAVGAVIGIGWITALGLWLAQAGPIGTMLGFVGGCLIILPIGLCYAEMATLVPRAGGEVAFAGAAFSRDVTFAVGWLLALSFLSVIVFEAISAGWILAVLAPATKGPVLYLLGAEVHAGALAIGALGTLAIAATTHLGGRATARLQDAATYSKLAASTVFIALGLLWGHPVNLEPAFVEGPGRPAFAGVVAILVTTPFWLAGFNVAAQAIGESAIGARPALIGGALLAAVGVALLFYCGVVAAAGMALPRAELLRLELPAAGAIEASLGSPVFGRLVLVAGLLGVVSTWNAVFFAATRLLYALGRDGLLPAAFARLDPRRRTPTAAVILCAAVGVAGAMLGRKAIGPIVGASATCIAVMFVTVAAAVIRLRRTRPSDPRPFRVPGGTPVAAIALVLALLLVGLALWQPLSEAHGGPPTEWLILAGWAAAGAVVHAARRRTKGLPTAAAPGAAPLVSASQGRRPDA